MNLLKQLVIAVLWMMVIGISGCAQSLLPHEELNQAFKKSFDATGLNYSSKSRITKLSIPKQDAHADTGDKRLQYLGTGLDIVRGFSVNAEGAIDMKAKKSEVLYDLHYDKDNVEVSIKIPLLMDYNTQTMYVGTSFFNTILETVYPQAPTIKGRLIRININELLRENSARVTELSKIVAENRFSSKNIDVLNDAIKVGILKSLAKLDDTCFSDQPLTGQDKKAGVERRIHVTLNHNDSVMVILDIIDGVAQTLFQTGVISKSEYAVLLTLTDRQTLDGVINKFTLAMIFDVGISPSGLVSRMESQLNVADKEGLYQLGLNNDISFSGYNAPHFSINPEVSGIVDLKELLGSIMTDKAKKQSSSQSNPDAPDGSEITKDANQGGS